MAISRPMLLAVLGAVLLGATVLAVQNARTVADNDAAPALVQTEGAAVPADAPSTSGPADTLRSAFDLSDLRSARFRANLYVVDRATRARLSLAGAFDTAGDAAIPRFHVRADLMLNGAKASGGFVSLGDRAYFVRGDTGWRVPAALWTPLAQTKLQLGLHPATWVRDVKSEGTARIAGVETEHVSARVDPQAVANDLAQTVRESGAELPSQPALTRTVKSAELDVWVGKDDHIIRQFSAQLIGPRKQGLELDVRLTDVNKPQQIDAPARVRAGAPGGVFGSFAEFVAGGIADLSGAPKAPSLAALTSPNPGRAARAVRNHKPVVILFRNPRGLDDRAMASVIRDVDRRTNALVLTDEVDAVERYGKLVEDLGVSQTPSVVIISRSGEAQLIEGYVDSDTLTQAVADAR
jgi:hypothetical protein